MKIIKKILILISISFLILGSFEGYKSLILARDCRQEWDGTRWKKVCYPAGNDGDCARGYYSCNRGYNCCKIGTSDPPKTCNSQCPATAPAKSSPWIEGTAPTGYIAACKTSTDGTAKARDCGTCSSTRNWYLPDSPTTPPPAPTGIQYCINNLCTTLSTDPNNPTIVAPPLSSDTTRFKVLPGTIPVGARDKRFRWRLDNMVNAYNCSNSNDFCGNDDTDIYTDNFATTFSPGGGEYSIKYFNGALKSCTNTNIYENVGLTSYIEFDHIPTIVSGFSNSTISGTLTDTDNGPELICSDNNPFTFELRYRDLDGASDLDELGFWIDDVTPASSEMRNSIHGRVIRDGGTWKSQGYSCDNNGNNCVWNVLGPTVPSTSESICITGSSWSDVLSSNVQCDSKIGSWTATSIQADANGTDIVVTYKVWMDSDIAVNLHVYGKAWDTKGISSTWVDKLDRTLDFVAPTTTIVSPLTVIGATTANLNWSVVDAISGVTDIFGEASLLSSGLVNGPITNETRGVENYKIDGTEIRDLWHVTNPVSGTETINFLTNEGNEISFAAKSLDGACNLSDGISDGQAVQTLDEPWFITKGGSFYSTAGVNIPNRSIFGTGILETLTPEVDLWSAPYSFATEDPETGINDITSSTELFSIGGGAWDIQSVSTNPAVGYGLSGLFDGRNNSGMYSSMSESLYDDFGQGVTVIPLGDQILDTSTYSKSTDINGCDVTSEVCLFTASNLSLVTATSSTPFVCDKPTVFVIDGDILLEPNILKGTGPKDGCMFVSGSTITVDTGMVQDVNPACNSGTLTNAEICYPQYDLIEAFLIADEHIIFKEDVPSLMYEGLLIHGSVIAFGGDSTTPSIHWSRTLKLINNPRFPSLVVHYDSTYLDLGRSVFTFEYPAYVVDVGYKP